MTARWVETVKTGIQQTDYFDKRQPGLVLRVGRRDKVWYVFYRVQGQKQKRRMRIGSYPSVPLSEAREGAYNAIKKAKRGEDPAVEIFTMRNALNFSAVVDEFFQHWDVGEAWRKEAKRLLDRDVLPRWKNIKTQDLRRRDVLALMDSIASRGANTTARRTLAVVRKILNWAVEREMIDNNPAMRVRGPGKERQKERVLTREEIKQFWEVIDKTNMDMPIRLALQFIITTGQRPGEVRVLKWEDIDMKECLWTLPKTKAGRTHRVPLSNLAMDLIRAAPRMSTYVFAGRTSTKPLGISSLGTAMRKCVARIEGVNPATPHDLRRTAGTLMAEAGVPRLVISKVLNHTEGGVTAIYDRYGYDKEKADALRRLESILRGIISSQDVSKIVRFPGSV